MRQENDLNEALGQGGTGCGGTQVEKDWIGRAGMREAEEGCEVCGGLEV